MRDSSVGSHEGYRAKKKCRISRVSLAWSGGAEEWLGVWQKFGVRGPPRPPRSPLAVRNTPVCQGTNPPRQDPGPTIQLCSLLLPSTASPSMTTSQRTSLQIFTETRQGGNSMADKLRLQPPPFQGSTGLGEYHARFCVGFVRRGVWVIWAKITTKTCGQTWSHIWSIFPHTVHIHKYLSVLHSLVDTVTVPLYEEIVGISTSRPSCHANEVRQA